MIILRGIVRGAVGIPVSAMILATMLAGASESLAQPFEVIGLGERKVKGEDQRGFEAGKIGFEMNSAYQTGFSPEAEEATQFASELSFGLGLTDFLMIESGLVLTKEREGDFTTSNVAFEATFVPPFLHDTDFGAGVFVAIEPRIDDEATNEFVIGPVFEWEVGNKLQVTVNTFLEETFGRNSEEGLAFAYGWQVKREVADGVAVGLEGYGEIEDVFGDAPDFEEQEHRVGLVIYLDGEEAIGDGANFELSFGVLAGITSETPDVAFKLNVEIPLGKLWQN